TARVVADLHALDRLAIDMEDAADHLDAIARQADQPLDVVGPVVALALVARILEHRHVAALRLMEEDAAREEAEREWKRMLAVTVRAFRHEKIVADQQGRDHRPGRDVERLDEESAHDDGDQDGIDHRPHGLGPTARLVLPSFSPLDDLRHHLPTLDARIAGAKVAVSRPAATWERCKTLIPALRRCRRWR